MGGTASGGGGGVGRPLPRAAGGRADGLSPAAKVPGAAQRDPGQCRARDLWLRLRAARRDDPDARRGEAAHRHPRSAGRWRGADPPHAYALQRDRAHDPRAQHAPRPQPERLRQRHRRHRRGRLHPGGPGHSRQVRLGRRLRHESPPARAPQPDARRSRNRHLRHHRLAGEERARDERPGRHPGHLVRRLPALDGARRPASRAQGGGAHEPHGRRVDGRRLVPQRRLPPAGNALHLRAGGHAEERRRASSGAAAGSSRSASGARSSNIRATTPSGGTRRWTRCWPPSP